MRVNTRYINSTIWGCTPGEDVHLMEFMYLYVRMPGESYRRRLRSSLLYLCYAFGIWWNKPTQNTLILDSARREWKTWGYCLVQLCKWSGVQVLCVFATSALRCGRVSKWTRDEEQAKRTRQKKKTEHRYKTLRRFDIKCLRLEEPILIQKTIVKDEGGQYWKETRR